jgi:predicted aspartyl protease
MSLAHIRAMYLGAIAHDRERTSEVVEDWKLLQDNMQGTFRSRRYLANSVETTTLGPFTALNGVHNGVRWQQNRNGMTFTFAGVHDRDAISDRAFRLAAPDRPEVHVLGESPANGAYVVEVQPPLGRHEWLFFDKKTGELVRRERVERDRRYTTTYENFRTFDGDPTPTRVHTVDSLGNERDQQLVARTTETTADLRRFEPPPSRRTLVEFPAHTGNVRLPARLVNGLFVVRVNIANHGYDFLLDTGASGVIIDTTFAESLGLERFGSRNGNTAGTYVESTATVPQMSIGPLRMERIVTRVVPLPFRPDASSRIVGLLGFDFFEDVVAHVDFANGAVEVASAQDGPRPAGIPTLALALDDKSPLARASVDESVAARLVLDTGANRTLLFAPFCDRAALAYDRLATTVRYRAVGGLGTGVLARFRSIAVGGTALANPTVEVASDNLGTEDTDGIIGTDLMRSLDVTFDFRNAVAYVRRAQGRPAPHR